MRLWLRQDDKKVGQSTLHPYVWGLVFLMNGQDSLLRVDTLFFFFFLSGGVDTGINKLFFFFFNFEGINKLFIFLF